MVHPVHNLSGPRVTRANRSHCEPDTAHQLLYVIRTGYAECFTRMTALRDKQRLKWWYPALLTALSFAIYWPAFFYDSFQPETALYYFYSDGRNFLQALQSYGYLSLMWYRPTPSMFYWIGQQFLGWHDLLGWKLFHFVTVLAAAYAIYWLVARCFSGGRLAGILAATCFLAHPNVYPGIMEVAGFDFLHIVLTILCVGLYFQAATASVARSLWLTALSWLCCVIALTSKEMALALPPYLLVMSVLLVASDPQPPGEHAARTPSAAAVLPVTAGLLFHASRQASAHHLPIHGVLPFDGELDRDSG